MLGFIATPQGTSIPQTKAGFAHGGDDPRLFAPYYPGAAASLQRAARQGVGRRLAQLAARARPDHPPHADDRAGRRHSLSLARRRHAPARPRRLDLYRQVLRRERREGVRREDRHRQGQHRRLRGPDRGQRPDVDQVHPPGQGALPAGLERAERRDRQGRDRRPHRHHRHERRGPARSQGDAARSLGAGRRAARPGHRADPARRLPAAARLRHAGRAPLHPGARHPHRRPDLSRAARLGSAVLGGVAVAAVHRRLLVRLRCLRLAGRSGLSRDRAHRGLSRRHAVRVPAHRARAEPRAPRFLPLHGAGPGRAARRRPVAAQARRRDARHDAAVQRRARLHHDLRGARRRGAHPLPQQPVHAA